MAKSNAKRSEKAAAKRKSRGEEEFDFTACRVRGKLLLS